MMGRSSSASQGPRLGTRPRGVEQPAAPRAVPGAHAGGQRRHRHYRRAKRRPVGEPGRRGHLRLRTGGTRGEPLAMLMASDVAERHFQALGTTSRRARRTSTGTSSRRPGATGTAPRFRSPSRSARPSTTASASSPASSATSPSARNTSGNWRRRTSASSSSRTRHLTTSRSPCGWCRATSSWSRTGTARTSTRTAGSSSSSRWTVPSGCAR